MNSLKNIPLLLSHDDRRLFDHHTDARHLDVHEINSAGNRESHIIAQIPLNILQPCRSLQRAILLSDHANQITSQVKNANLRPVTGKVDDPDETMKRITFHGIMSPVGIGHNIDLLQLAFGKGDLASNHRLGGDESIFIYSGNCRIAETHNEPIAGAPF